MIRRTMRWGVIVGLVAGTVYGLVRALRGPAAPAFERPATGAWPSLAGSAVPEPTRAAPAGGLGEPKVSEPLLAAGDVLDGVGPSPTDRAWVFPADGGCPTGHPIKAKLKSGIYHEPGGLSYDRTVPDRCYADAAAADADGLRPAKR